MEENGLSDAEMISAIIEQQPDFVPLSTVKRLLNMIGNLERKIEDIPLEAIGIEEE